MTDRDNWTSTPCRCSISDLRLVADGCVGGLRCLCATRSLSHSEDPDPDSPSPGACGRHLHHNETPQFG
jgi:hypothetical protein